MATQRDKIESNQIGELSTSELDMVTGGASIVGLSVANQSAIALADKLSAIYQANHPIRFPLNPLPH